MTVQTLKERITSYKEANSLKLMRRVPIIINVNGRAFARITNDLSKPYCAEFMNAMCATSIKLCHEITGSVFAYCFNDNITIVTRNDQSNETMPWFQNDAQKIVSASASIATLEFSNAARDLGLKLAGDATFASSVYAVPNLTEAINVLVAMQQVSTHSSLNFASYYELYKKYGQDAYDIVQGRTAEEKEELLTEECGIAFNNYPSAFRRGVAFYRAPTLVSSAEGQIMKNKWVMNNEIPIFTKDQTFLTNIFKSGADIYRANPT